MRAAATAQPNIALIKYWGKRDLARNLPAVGSISISPERPPSARRLYEIRSRILKEKVVCVFGEPQVPDSLVRTAVGSISITLRDLFTEMQVELDDGLAADRLTVNGSVDEAMLPRLSACLDVVIGAERSRANIVSRCNFPIAAGLASSASAFAAATLAAAEAAGLSFDNHTLANLAGRCSGSAARSLLGGFVELENRDGEIGVRTIRDRSSWPLAIVVAVTEAGPKPVGSTKAMEISRKTSPFYSNWVERQDEDIAAARSAILSKDFQQLAAVAEHNCLKMHSMMWASRPPTVFWNSATMHCLQTVRRLQRAGVAVFFTIDAGPQVKAICLPEYREEVRASLASTRGVIDVLVTGLGEAARLLDSQ